MQMLLSHMLISFFIFTKFLNLCTFENNVYYSEIIHVFHVFFETHLIFDILLLSGSQFRSLLQPLFIIVSFFLFSDGFMWLAGHWFSASQFRGFVEASRGLSSDVLHREEQRRSALWQSSELSGNYAQTSAQTGGSSQTHEAHVWTQDHGEDPTVLF